MKDRFGNTPRALAWISFQKPLGKKNLSALVNPDLYKNLEELGREELTTSRLIEYENFSRPGGNQLNLVSRHRATLEPTNSASIAMTSAPIQPQFKCNSGTRACTANQTMMTEATERSA